MNRIRHIARLAAALAGLALTWLGLAATAPAAFAATATRIPNPGGVSPSTPLPVVHTVIVGGMPGWQIALIAIGAALFAAASAVLAYRALAARRQPVTAAA
jgi:hypothetical protein